MKARNKLALSALLCLAALVVSACSSGGSVGGSSAATSKSQGLQVVTIAIRPSLLHGPIFVAKERGYFAAAGIDLQIKPLKGSTAAAIPLLARGDIDLLPTGANPAVLNAAAQGFDLKILAAYNEPKVGWADSAHMVVRQDIWNKKPLANASDLRGLKVAGGGPQASGTPLDLLTLRSLAKGGLTDSDVSLSANPRTPDQMLQNLKNKSVDVQPVVEPEASIIEAEGVGHRWLGMADVFPGWQGSFIISSAGFLRDHRDIATAFLTALLRAGKDFNNTNGKWTPQLQSIVAKAMAIDAKVIDRAGIPYFPLDGAINRQAIVDEQRTWVSLGLVKKPTDLDTLIDTGPLQAALRQGK